MRYVVAASSPFALVGERKQTNFNVDVNAHIVDESFEIVVRNRKKQSVEMRVVEYLYRGANREIRQPSVPFKKQDARTIELRVPIAPDEEERLPIPHTIPGDAMR